MMMNYATTNKARNMLADVIAKVCVKRSDLSYDVLKVIRKELDEQDYKDLKMYLITLERLMKIFDNY